MVDDAPTPGWYPDPETGRQRWFDGKTWGPLAPEAGDGPAAAPVDVKIRPAAENVVVLGYVFALLFSPIGLILGFYCLNRPSERTRMHGAGILGLAVIGSVWLVAALVSAGAL